MSVLLIIWVAVLTIAVVVYKRQMYTKLSCKGINHLPIVPGLGNMAPIAFGTGHFAETLMKVYHAFPDDRIVGQYIFQTPAVLIKDVELIKKITLKDFDHFVNRQPFIDEIMDPFFGRNLLSLKGDEWKDMRSTLSPAFTSSKMRLMLPLMVEVADQMIETVTEKIEASENDYLDIECKQLSTRVANDVIASCAFGLHVDSLASDNQFYVIAKSVTNFSSIKLLGSWLMPEIMKLLKIHLLPQSTTDFFKDIVLDSMEHREQRNIIRNDMIHLLMEIRIGRLTHDSKIAKDTDAGFATVEESSMGKNKVDRDWSDNDLVVQAMLFLLAGFDTVSTAMSFLLHELALNPDVQDRLAKEIREEDKKNGGEFDYNTVKRMPYLDMVVSELLRFWSPIVVLDRICTKDYNLGKPNSKATEDCVVRIRKGDVIFIPTWPIQRDAKYFPNPDKFDPERFSEENKHNINPFTYMPFGMGPRSCIGSRFALYEIKVIAYKLLLHMEVSPCEKTCIPTKLNDGFNMRLKGGHWLRMKLRKRI